MGVADTCRNSAEMEFGLSLDPLAVSQRHTLYDSESEEETEPQSQSELDSAFVVDGRSTNFEERFLAGKRLFVAVGSSASVFVRSFIRLREESLCSVRADAAKVQKGKHFSSGNGTEEITQFHEVEGNTEWAVCYHDTELRLEYCNLWTEKVYTGNTVSMLACISFTVAVVGIQPRAAETSHRLYLPATL